jgi:hypothetical protein
LFIHVQGDLINFIIIAYGIHPSCGHVLLQGGSYTNKIPDRGSSCPRTFLGSYPPRSKTKDQPMPQAWVPWTFPGALDISRGFNLLGPRPRTPVIYWGPLQGSFAAWSQTKNPSHLLGALSGVLSTKVQDQGSTHAPGMGTLDISRGPRHI